MQTKIEHLLTKLGEEAGEVVQSVAKSLIFGLQDHDPGDPDQTPNYEKLDREINDLVGVAWYLQHELQFTDTKIELSPSAQMAKWAKIDKWMLHAYEQGTLDHHPDCGVHDMLKRQCTCSTAEPGAVVLARRTHGDAAIKLIKTVVEAAEKKLQRISGHGLQGTAIANAQASETLSLFLTQFTMFLASIGETDSPRETRLAMPKGP